MEKENRGGDPAAYPMSPEKGKMMMPLAAAEEESDAGVDELLAALGYKVRSSDMADVAQKLEQLEMAMAISGPAVGGASCVADDNAILSHLASDTVHYNPSDISSWLESMLSEINAPPLPPPLSSFSSHNPYGSSCLLDPFDAVAPAESSTTTTIAATAAPPEECISYRSDISTSPGQQVETGRDPKRMRSSSSSSSTSRAGGATVMGSSFSTTTKVVDASSSVTTGGGGGMPVVVVDTQEAGIRLVHALLGCAEAVQQENLAAADALLKQITVLAASQGGAMRKVAGCFAQALARRVYRLPLPVAGDHSDYLSDVLDMHFYESCPYIKFGHFTANQALLEAFAGHRRVHVVDFSMKQGMQWPALMQALALRPGGPPSFRLTGIGPPQADNSDALQQVGLKLTQLAESIHIDFEFRGFIASSLADLEPSMLRTDSEDEEEAVAVSSIVELHRLLPRPGALEKVLSTVRALKPRIFTVVEQEASHNAGTFVERFTEALHYYSTMFDSVEMEAAAAPEQVMTEVYLGQQIHNVVACEGADRTERHETLAQWRRRLMRDGFEPVHIGSNAYKQASMLLSVYAGGDGYRVEERDGCLTLGWHTRPLFAASAWCVAGGGAPLPDAALR